MISSEVNLHTCELGAALEEGNVELGHVRGSSISWKYYGDRALSSSMPWQAVFFDFDGYLPLEWFISLT
jgi:hypothetical protein